MSLRLVDLLAGLSCVADLGFGLEAGTSLRSAALAALLGEDLELSRDQVRDGIHTALLHHVGCTGHAHETAQRIGDELAFNRAAARADHAAPADMLRTFLPTLVQGRAPRDAAGMVLRTLAAGQRHGRDYTVTACEVGRHVANRLGLSDQVQQGVFHVFELWQGGGHPGGLVGEDIPLPSRLARLTGIAATFDRLGGPQVAADAVSARAGGMLDPTLAVAFTDRAAELLVAIDQQDPRAVVLASEPAPVAHVLEPDLVTVATVFGDVADLKTPFAHGHSRGVAALAGGGGRELGLAEQDVVDLTLAGHLHDLGRVAVSSRTWEKAGPLSEVEWEQVRLHPYHSERILAGSQRLESLAGLVGRHHERLDGSGYHRGCGADGLSQSARVLATADAYRTMVEPRPHRAALAPEQARDRLQRSVAEGRIDADAAAAVLTVAGHEVTPVRREPPAGLTPREVEVLRLVANGSSNRDIGRTLHISRRTAEHHVQHIYAKVGVSSRAAVALFAMEHHLL